MSNIKNSNSWTTEDKKKLLELLHKHGCDYETIQQELRHKSFMEIQSICDKHTLLASTASDFKKRENPMMSDWIKILQRMQDAQADPIKNIIPRVLKYIALFEKRTDSSSINLQECYQILSDICNGFEMKDISEGNNFFIYECVKKLAKSLKGPDTGRLGRTLRSVKTLRMEEKKDSYSIINPLELSQEDLIYTSSEININIFDE